MSKIIKDTDTVNLIKAGCNQTLNLIQPEITNLNTDISNLDDNITLYTSETGYKAYFDIRRTGKLYQVKVPKYNYNTSPTCIKTLDNAGLICIPSTNLVENQDDYQDIELFKWYRCNYTRNQYGIPTITAVEDTDDFATTGNVDVGTFGMSFYWSWIDGSDSNYSSLNLDSNYYYLTISDMPNTTWGLNLWTGCQDEQGNDIGYWCYSTYFSGNVNQDLRSQPNLFPVRWMCYNYMASNSTTTITDNNKGSAVYMYQHKGSGYWGAGLDRHLFGYIFYMIKYASKSSQVYFTGCTNYNLQYIAADTTLTNTNYFPVTQAQANNFVIGSSVCVGNAYVSNNAKSIDRNNSSMFSKVRIAKISEIKQVPNQSYYGIYLVDEDGNNVTISDTSSITSGDFTLETYISVLPWISGNTDNIINKHDGQVVNNSKYPYRIQGVEYSIGGWTVVSDTVMNITSDTNVDFYQVQKGITHVKGTSGTAMDSSTYKAVGSMITTSKDNFRIGDVALYNYSESSKANCVNFYPIVKQTVDNSAHGVGDYCYRNTTSGTTQYREVLLGGTLGDTASAGFCDLHCSYSLSNSYWHIVAAD